MCVSCTGGRHRSVVANRLAELAAGRVHVYIDQRDMERAGVNSVWLRFPGWLMPGTHQALAARVALAVACGPPVCHITRTRSWPILSALKR